MKKRLCKRASILADLGYNRETTLDASGYNAGGLLSAFVDSVLVRGDAGYSGVDCAASHQSPQAQQARHSGIK